MEFITINEINKTISISRNCFQDLIKLLPKRVQDIKIIGNPEIEFVRNGKNVQLEFDFKIKEGIDFDKKIIEMRRSLENSILRLLDIKPYDITMNWLGRF
ncbi:MAG: MMB_0454 family protein [Metamycoplasmataceae bacterium]